MKVRRNLSGVYFRSKNIDTGKFDNVCFEDLTEDQQDEILNKRGEDYLKSLIKVLSSTINRIGEEFDLITG